MMYSTWAPLVDDAFFLKASERASQPTAPWKTMTRLWLASFSVLPISSTFSWWPTSTDSSTQKNSSWLMTTLENASSKSSTLKKMSGKLHEYSAPFLSILVLLGDAYTRLVTYDTARMVGFPSGESTFWQIAMVR